MLIQLSILLNRGGGAREAMSPLIHPLDLLSKPFKLLNIQITEGFVSGFSWHQALEVLLI